MTDAISPNLVTVVRVENRVLVFSSGGVGGEMEPFTTEFLEGYVGVQDDEPLKLPTMESLPAGWVHDGENGPTDILDRVNPEGTPAADWPALTM